jgi:hypothetical protein
LDGTVFAIGVDKNAPSSRTYLANTARDAVVGQAKNRSPVHLLTRFPTRPHAMFIRLARQIWGFWTFPSGDLSFLHGAWR